MMTWPWEVWLVLFVLGSILFMTYPNRISSWFWKKVFRK